MSIYRRVIGPQPHNLYDDGRFGRDAVCADFAHTAPDSALLENAMQDDGLFRFGVLNAAGQVNTLFSKLNRAIIRFNKTRQGYARKRILKPAGYFLGRSTV